MDLARPDFGDAVTIHEGEIPVFWACGVTPQLALAAAAPEIAITHSPGCMFVTDWKEEAFCTRVEKHESQPGLRSLGCRRLVP